LANSLARRVATTMDPLVSLLLCRFAVLSTFAIDVFCDARITISNVYKLFFRQLDGRSLSSSVAPSERSHDVCGEDCCVSVAPNCLGFLGPENDSWCTGPQYPNSGTPQRRCHLEPQSCGMGLCTIALLALLLHVINSMMDVCCSCANFVFIALCFSSNVGCACMRCVEKADRMV
jgi:hypothetical protein